MSAQAATVSQRSVIEGRWVRLVPVSAYTNDAIEALRIDLGLRPEMVAPGMEGAPAGSSRFGEAAVIADRATGQPLGVIGNTEILEFPGVAALVIYVDEGRARAGYAMEAYFRYVERIFHLGAQKVQMEVLEFNTPVHRIMRKIGARPEAVLREHFYIAGRHWDATLYSVDRQLWQTLEARFRPVVERPSALASSRQSPDAVRLQEEAKPLKIDYLILADAAIVADGKHYLHGAGWETIVAASFPVFHRRISAALRLHMGAGPSQRLGMDVVDAAGTSLLAEPIYMDVTPQGVAAAQATADGPALCLVFNFDGLHFTAPGAYAMVVSIAGSEVHRAPFYVEKLGTAAD